MPSSLKDNHNGNSKYKNPHKFFSMDEKQESVMKIYQKFEYKPKVHKRKVDYNKCSLSGANIFKNSAQPLLLNLKSAEHISKSFTKVYKHSLSESSFTRSFDYNKAFKSINDHSPLKNKLNISENDINSNSWGSLDSSNMYYHVPVESDSVNEAFDPELEQLKEVIITDYALGKDNSYYEQGKNSTDHYNDNNYNVEPEHNFNEKTEDLIYRIREKDESYNNENDEKEEYIDKVIDKPFLVDDIHNTNKIENEYPKEPYSNEYLGEYVINSMTELDRYENNNELVFNETFQSFTPDKTDQATDKDKDTNNKLSTKDIITDDYHENYTPITQKYPNQETIYYDNENNEECNSEEEEDDDSSKLRKCQILPIKKANISDSVKFDPIESDIKSNNKSDNKYDIINDEYEMVFKEELLNDSPNLTSGNQSLDNLMITHDNVEYHDNYETNIKQTELLHSENNLNLIQTSNEEKSDNKYSPLNTLEKSYQTLENEDNNKNSSLNISPYTPFLPNKEETSLEHNKFKNLNDHPQVYNQAEPDITDTNEHVNCDNENNYSENKDADEQFTYIENQNHQIASPEKSYTPNQQDSPFPNVDLNYDEDSNNHHNEDENFMDNSEEYKIIEQGLNNYDNILTFDDEPNGDSNLYPIQNDYTQLDTIDENDEPEDESRQTSIQKGSNTNINDDEGNASMSEGLSSNRNNFRNPFVKTIEYYEEGNEQDYVGSYMTADNKDSFHSQEDEKNEEEAINRNEGIDGVVEDYVDQYNVREIINNNEFVKDNYVEYNGENGNNNLSSNQFESNDQYCPKDRPDENLNENLYDSDYNEDDTHELETNNNLNDYFYPKDNQQTKDRKASKPSSSSASIIKISNTINLDENQNNTTVERTLNSKVSSAKSSGRFKFKTSGGMLNHSKKNSLESQSKPQYENRNNFFSCQDTDTDFLDNTGRDNRTKKQVQFQNRMNQKEIEEENYQNTDNTFARDINNPLTDTFAYNRSETKEYYETRDKSSKYEYMHSYNTNNEVDPYENKNERSCLSFCLCARYKSKNAKY